MIDGQSENVEHQVAKYLGTAAHPHIAGARGDGDVLATVVRIGDRRRIDA